MLNPWPNKRNVRFVKSGKKILVHARIDEDNTAVIKPTEDELKEWQRRYPKAWKSFFGDKK